MEKNPILINYRTQGLYIILWVFITGIQVFVNVHFSDLPWAFCVVRETVFNGFFALLLLPVWYPVRFNDWARRAWGVNVMTHLALAVIFVALSLSLGYFVMWWLALDYESYTVFLELSHWAKIIQGFLCYLIGVLSYYLYIHVKQLNEKAANEVRLMQLVKDSELNLLKAQINPHFLFNSLNSLNSLIIHDAQRAQKMLVALSDYLRYAVLAHNNREAELRHEVENIERYLAIEKLRFGDKLVYESTIDPACLPVKIPAMLLQPLFENAVKHGVYESLQAVRITAVISRDERQLTVAVSNDYDAQNASPKTGAGAGLPNIRERLRLSYGTHAALKTKTENGKFIATLKIPLKNIPDENG
jgi:sensor histidine kinase YesM